MLRGIYTSASGMLTEQRRMEAVANNLANLQTAGYKRDVAVAAPFHEILLQRANDPVQPAGAAEAPRIGLLGLGTQVALTASILATGRLEETGNPLDLAIDGDGFFAIETPAGLRYTRHGRFQQDASGRLVTLEGHPLLVDGQPVQATGPLRIAPDGQVFDDGRLLGRLSILTSPELGALRKEGAGLWAPAGPGDQTQLLLQGQEPGRYRLQVGALEASNVDPAAEMVEMITIMRAHEANQRAIQAQDEALAKAANEIGRVG